MPDRAMPSLRHAANWRRTFPAVPDAAPWCAWVTAPGSLTRHLQQVFGDFRVQRLSQGLLPASPDDARIFSLHRPTRLPMREVLLWGGVQPLVFAHTVVQSAALHDDWPFWVGLGSRSLGSALFCDAAITRGPFAYARLRPHHDLYRRAMSAVMRVAPAVSVAVGGRALYARHSFFARKNGHLVVTEVFLPMLLRHARQSTLTNQPTRR